jgi:hypothetical protein
MHMHIIGAVLAAFLWALFVPHSFAGSIAQEAAKAAARRLAATTAVRSNAVSNAALRRDAIRDHATPARPLAKERHVQRYTTREQAAKELTRGIPPGRHMTAQASPGKPLHARAAQRRYGLPSRPEVRETIRLPQGQPVKSNKVVGGSPGVGEVTSTKRIPPGNIVQVAPIKE